MLNVLLGEWLLFKFRQSEMAELSVQQALFIAALLNSFVISLQTK
jgi:hypothetical protein